MDPQEEWSTEQLRVERPEGLIGNQFMDKRAAKDLPNLCNFQPPPTGGRGRLKVM